MYLNGSESTFHKSGSLFREPESTFREPESTFCEPGSIFREPESTFREPESAFREPGSTFCKPSYTFAYLSTCKPEFEKVNLGSCASLPKTSPLPIKQKKNLLGSCSPYHSTILRLDEVIPSSIKKAISCFKFVILARPLVPTLS